MTVTGSSSSSCAGPPDAALGRPRLGGDEPLASGRMSAGERASTYLGLGPDDRATGVRRRRVLRDVVGPVIAVVVALPIIAFVNSDWGWRIFNIGMFITIACHVADTVQRHRTADGVRRF